MARTVEVAVEPLSAAAFAPFGAIIGAGTEPPALDWGTCRPGWHRSTSTTRPR
ncbi:MAG: hypothetical protein AB7K67_16420 [Hyphomicrobiaceae bacterium]